MNKNKVYTDLFKSIEKTEDIYSYIDAVRQALVKERNKKDSYTYIEALTLTYVIYCVENNLDMYKSFYTRNDDGTFTFQEPIKVKKNVIVTYEKI